VKNTTKGMSTSNKVLRRLAAYGSSNAFIIIIALQSLYSVEPASGPITSSPKVLGLFAVSALFRMFSCTIFFEWLASSRKLIREHDSTKERSDKLGSVINMLSTLPFLELAQYAYLTRYFGLVNMRLPTSLQELVWEYLLFIPKSFLVELMFDFGHYWTHRLAHKIKWLYRVAHATHHRDSNPSPWTTFDQSFLEVVITNMIPLLVALSLCPRLSLWQFHLLLAYKTYTEVAGHCGIDSNGVSFPQCPGIFMRVFTNVCITNHEHHEHHRVLYGNFSKRFRLWDVVFGTYIRPPNQAKTKCISSDGWESVCYSALLLTSSATVLSLTAW
jgi:sterol desaturase/sphingolipid hydroxylase (fatty acid hydroxylase superfamily)